MYRMAHGKAFTGKGSRQLRFSAGNQRGMALVIALIMLVLLGMLGALALDTTTVEMHIAGNYRNQQYAFFNADRLQAWGPHTPVVDAAIIPYVVDSYPTGTGYQEVPLPAGSVGKTFVRVKFICMSKSPSDPDNKAVYNYLVTIIGQGANNAEYVVESQVSRERPKPSGLDPDC